MKKEIETLNTIISNGEKQLWHGKVSQKGLQIIIGKVIGMLGLLILAILVLVLCTMVSELNFELKLIILFVGIVIISLGFLVPIILYAFYFLELRNLEYYLTNMQEFDVKAEKVNFHTIYYDVFQRLKLDDIERIKIIPLRLFSLAHIDFYSQLINEYPNDFYFGIRKIKNNLIDIEKIDGKKEHIFERFDPELPWKNTQRGSKHRFYYIKDYKNVLNILKETIPEKVKIVK